jgi:hypothetical protein
MSTDDTIYAEDIESRISNRCLDSGFPNVSDLLGSDWASSYNTRGWESPEQYRNTAIAHAHRIYPSYWARK